MEYVKWSVRSAWEDYLEGDCQLRVAQMDRLREHKYSSVDTSWLDEYCMKRYFLKRFPCQFLFLNSFVSCLQISENFMCVCVLNELTVAVKSMKKLITNFQMNFLKNIC